MNSNQKSGNSFILLSTILVILLGIITAYNYKVGLIIGFSLILSILLVVKPHKSLIYMIGIWSVVQGVLSSFNMYGIPLSQLFIIILIPLIILCIFTTHKKNNAFLHVSYLYLIMVAWSVVGLLMTQYLTEALASYVRLLAGGLLFYYLLIRINNLNENRKIANTLLVFASISSIYTCVQLALFNLFGIKDIFGVAIVSIYYGDAVRPSGGFGGPVASALSLYVFLIISIYMFNVYKRKIYIIISITILFGMLATLTRTTIIALIITILIQLIYYLIVLKNIKKFMRIAIPLLIFSTLIFITFRDIVVARLVDFTTDAGDSSNFGAGRVGIWQSVIKGMSEEGNFFTVLIGHGIESSRYFVLKYSIFNLEDYTHNDYLDTFLTNGMLGFILMILFLYTILKILFKNSNSKQFIFLLIPIATYIVCIMFISNTQYSAGPRWMFLILIVFALKEVNMKKSI